MLHSYSGQRRTIGSFSATAGLLVEERLRLRVTAIIAGRSYRLRIFLILTALHEHFSSRGNVSSS